MRTFVTLAHLALAGGNAATALWYLAQSRLNLLWENAYYAQSSIGTQVAMISGVLSLTFAVLQATLAIGHGLRRPRASRGLLVLSFLFLLVAPAPLSWFLALLTGSVWVSLLAPPPAGPKNEP